MILFNNRRPRRFHHVMIYSDERKERLRDIEERARRELGMLPQDSSAPERLRGAFTGRAERLRRKSGRRHTGRMSTATLVIAIIALLLLLHYLISG